MNLFQKIKQGLFYHLQLNKYSYFFMIIKLHKRLSTSKAFHRGFSLIDTVKSQDLNLEITRLMHQKSGAMIYNLKSNNSDNTFAPVVKTLPENDTGCPHILEHLACCGSERFPIRDPFFNMLRRSVNTYMNAWTGEDFTAYPFSSANPKDFDNLYKVYLDMSLRPLLNELDFRQEGWRYEIGQSGTKQVKGIVFNEMKGAYQNPDRQLYVQIANKLFANTPYGYDSGGKPDSIVKLSYEEVQNMHKYYYHPSNMTFYYYGNLDIKDKLTYLQEQYLLKHKYENKVSDHIKKANQLLSKMPTSIAQTFHTIYSTTSETPNIALTYNLGQLTSTDGVELTSMNILSYLLLQTNQAIFYQEFIQNNLADSFGMSGFNAGSILTFGITLKNAKISSQQVLSRVQKCIRAICQNGIDVKRLEQYISQTELDILTPSQTQGIKYLGHCLPYMVNRLSLINIVNIRKNLNEAVSKLKQKEYLTNLLNKNFLKNPRKLVITQQTSKAKAQQPYSKIVGLQIPQELIKTQQKQLQKRQQSNSQNSVECLPKLSLTDLTIPAQTGFQIKRHQFGSNNQQIKNIFVPIDIKDINFIRVVYTLDMGLQENSGLLRYFDIWRYALKQGIAVKGLTNKQLSSKLNTLTHNFDIRLQKSSPKNPTLMHIVFSASTLSKNIDQYLQILNKLIFQPDYNQEEISNIFRSYRSEKIQSLLDGGVMHYCLDYCGAQLNLQARIFDSYFWVTEGIKIAEQGTVPQQFNSIHNKLINEAGITVIQHSNEFKNNILQNLGVKFQKVKNQIHSKPTKKQAEDFSSTLISRSVTNSYDVNFCSQQYNGPTFLSLQHAHISLFVQILQQEYLHKKIRQKGGAYGARAVYRDNGTIALYSYMDPYSNETYLAFDESLKQIFAFDLSNERLEEVKIKVIGALDTPIVPQTECLGYILKGYQKNQRDEFRKSIKQAKWNQILKTGQKYLDNTKKSRVMFGRDVPKQFEQQSLRIPKPPQEATEQA